eukprot:RCo004359
MQKSTEGNAESVAPKPASSFTLASHAKVRSQLDFADKRDFEEATRGHIAPMPDNGVIKDSSGRVVWDLSKFSFIDTEKPAPDTVNPSLWRQSCLVMIGGLFKVTDRLYQVRNADLSNLTIYEGNTGIILADPLISAETAKAALELYYAHRPRKPVVAVIYTHSHVDHYGGVRGVVSEEDVKSGKVQIIAPVGFMEAAVSENLYAGTAMSRRAEFMYGNLLPPSTTGRVGAGLGLTCSEGMITLIAPTKLITENGQTLNLDGLNFEFMLAPDTEAPAEMHYYVKELKAVTAAENCVHTLHNTYTLRGAKIRDPLAWSKCLDDTLARWGDQAEIMYGMHHWPVWGLDRVEEVLSLSRDAYRFINDQTLRLANWGYGPDDIANTLAFPEKIAKCWALRGYYGSLYHNVKATYVKYLGWYNGNPSQLHILPPIEAAKKYVRYMGGAEAVLKQAKEDYAKGEYRWVAEVAGRVVFADPTNTAARELEADALEQMGYQAESGPWRNFYLTGAQELRQGVKKRRVDNPGNADIARAIPMDMFLDYLGICLNAITARDTRMVLNLVFTDSGETFVLTLENGTLNHRAGATKKEASATLTMKKDVFMGMVKGVISQEQAATSGALSLQGEKTALPQLLSLLDKFTGEFPLLTPKAE